MTEPSRTSTDNTQGTEVASELDATLAPPAGSAALPQGKKEPASGFGPPDNPGELGRIGRYRVLKKLGQGGMGAVYLGTDAVLGRRVALKVMLPDHAADPESRARFLREARAVAMLKSDHVVTIYEAGEECGTAFIAMEYLVGSPLDQYLRAVGELPLVQVFRLARETALGLAAAHDLGLVHRDIKPGNIWLESPHGRVKILDFGLARAQTDDTHLTTTGIVVGTPAFMSPEQARGLKLDGRSDLFSLGVMLFRLATGKMPFDGSTTMALLTSLAVDTPPLARQLRADVPPALEAVINKLLAKNPADRYATAWEAAAALRDAENAPALDGRLPAGPATPMAVAPQSQNMWEGIAASGSTAQAIESGTDLAPVIEPKSDRGPARRRPSKTPWILAGLVALATFVALVLAVNVLIQPTKGKLSIDYEGTDAELRIEKEGGEVVRERTRDREIKLAPGRYSVTVVGGKSELRLEPDKFEITEGGETQVKVRIGRPIEMPFQITQGGDPDRRAALYALSLGGTVCANSSEANIAFASDLPRESFALTALNVSRKDQVTDAGLAVVQGCKNIKVLYLNNCPNLTDAGLVHFADCKNLTIVTLHGTAVTDMGLEYLKDRRSLVHLNVRGTRVSGEGVADLAKALPRCRIEWDGGTFTPKK